MFSVASRCNFKHDAVQTQFDKNMRAHEADARKKVRDASKNNQQDSNKRDRDTRQSGNRHHERGAKIGREREEKERQEEAHYQERSRARLEKEQRDVQRSNERREEREAQDRQQELRQEEHRKKQDAIEQQREQASNGGDWTFKTTLAEAENDTFSFAAAASKEEYDEKAEQEPTKNEWTERRRANSATRETTESDLSKRRTFNTNNGRGGNSRGRGRSSRDSERSNRGSERSSRDSGRSDRGSERSDRGSERWAPSPRRERSNQGRKRADRDEREKKAGEQGREDTTASVEPGLDIMSEYRTTMDLEQDRNIVRRDKTGSSPNVARRLGYDENEDDEHKQATGRKLVLRKEQMRMRGERALDALRRVKPMPNCGRLTMFEIIAMVSALHQEDGNANTKLDLKDPVTKLHAGIYPPDKGDRYRFAITLMNAYYNDNTNAKRALEKLCKGGDSARSKAIALAARETCILGYAKPGNDDNVLVFRDGNREIKDAIVSPLGLVFLKRIAEGLRIACPSPRITAHDGAMEVLFVQFPSTVDMACVSIDDAWARMVTPMDEQGMPKTLREVGRELALAFGECKPCAVGKCKHKSCNFGKSQKKNVEMALEYFKRDPIQLTVGKRWKSNTSDFLLS